ncbi:MAG TPA: flagellar FlbD family protein [Clostridia bacterium]|nr:flagellar FlbD family protein [Clostridia bacterium]
MIKVTKLNCEVFYINPFEIEFIEETPDTVISLRSGKKVLVSEKASQVIDEMIEFYRQTNLKPVIRNPEDGKEAAEEIQPAETEDEAEDEAEGEEGEF